MKTIIYTCPYIPAELIAAHGLHPCRVMPAAITSTGLLARAEGLCPYVHSFINEVMTGPQQADTCGVVVTTVCDQMRRAFDILVRRCDLPAFLMNVPHTWQSISAQKLYVDELKRLSRFLLRLGGKPSSDDTLVPVMLEYDAARASIINARGHLSARQYAESIAAFGRDGSAKMLRSETATKPPITGVPLAIVGGPLVRQDLDIFDIVEQSGGRVVLDATETGERGLCPPFDRRRIRDDPLFELANGYFNGITDASRRPNSGLYEWLKSRLLDRAVRGIVFRRYVWCDTWHAELWRLKEWTELPVLDIDVGGDNETHQHRAPNRIRSFLEMLS
jgi:benzoyl-CoA reductase/2-hydroxyglutaryl-CoA dehydratase subunit BcrC/BadD/HgdB